MFSNLSLCNVAKKDRHHKTLYQTLIGKSGTKYYQSNSSIIVDCHLRQNIHQLEINNVTVNYR